MNNIGILDYKAGNSQSVKNALDHLGISSKMIQNPADIADVERIILPGVGSADATIESLVEKNLVEALNKWVITDRKPFLGICIGHQIVFDHSEEGDTPCFGWIKGQVKRFSNPDLPIPQMGWNRVGFVDSAHPLLTNLENHYFYFVNSYIAQPQHKDPIFASAQYGGEFCASVMHQNIFTTQFHIEKSGPAGLKMLENFSRWNP